MIRESLKMAWSSLVSNKMRAFLTMLGIIVGIGSVIAVVAAGEGGKEAILGQFNEIGASTVMISVQRNNASNSDFITSADIDALKKQIPELNQLVAQNQVFSSAKSDNKSSAALITGVDQGFEYINPLNIQYGRGFAELDYSEGKKNIIIELSSALSFFGREDVVGETLDFSNGGRRMTARIVGVSASNSASYLSMMPSEAASEIPLIIYMPRKTSVELSGRGDRISIIMLMAKEPQFVESVGDQAIRTLERRHNNADREMYRKQNMADILKQVDSVVGMITSFISAVAAISLLVGGIGVMNIMLVSVTERTREIGTRKALGATTGDILQQFLTESVILTLAGGVIGIAFGIGLAQVIGYFANFPARISLSAVAIAVVFSSAVGLFFGIYPARKASKLNPIDALRYE